MIFIVGIGIYPNLPSRHHLAAIKFAADVGQANLFFRRRIYSKLAAVNSDYVTTVI